MRISDLIDLLTREMERLGNRELLQGVVFGKDKPFHVCGLLDGDQLGYPGAAIMHLLPPESAVVQHGTYAGKTWGEVYAERDEYNRLLPGKMGD